MHFIGCHVGRMAVQGDVSSLGREADVSFTIERLKGA